MNKEFIKALDDIEKDKGIDKNIILESIEKALVKSYEKNFDDNSNVEISINETTGDVTVYSLMEVVEEVENKQTQITLDEALTKKKRVSVGDILKLKIAPKNFGRVAAQTARNIVIQQIRDAERQAIYDDYIDREKELITGDVQRIDYNNIYINLGKTEGYIPVTEQVPNENIQPGDRVKLYVKEVKTTSKGPQIILSRSSANLIRRMFELEVPEIAEGTVEIMSVAREAGFRTKIAVYANDESVDPVGACVGLKGMRVNSIVEEINDEKIDIIVWSPDISVFVSNSLSPAEVVEVLVDEKEKFATAIVPDNQLSLAIGKEGQNVRLAAKLTDWKIDIKGESKSQDVHAEYEDKMKSSEEKTEEINEVEEQIEDIDGIDEPIEVIDDIEEIKEQTLEEENED